MPTAHNRRERTARFLTAYAEQLPMPTETRLELVLETLRALPLEASPEEALDALLSRLPAHDPEAYPPDHPAIHRTHMPAQYMGRPRSGLSGFMAQWGWLAILGLLLALTLLLTTSR